MCGGFSLDGKYRPGDHDELDESFIKLLLCYVAAIICDLEIYINKALTGSRRHLPDY